MLEQIQTDIWVRYQKSMGNKVIYVCADDTHGTATMLKAEAESTRANGKRAGHTAKFKIVMLLLEEGADIKSNKG